ncbi:hypothetical protein MLD38_026349 [Melastoma candidum]|uniref:Uncharacterized protein n=1 Tax=Melastoma candidum TaxID=119954 RepID=A0ACB9NY32_9MYRT|nr:hypothetical protein MLD38_026349 [Melastoma candidum]
MADAVTAANDTVPVEIREEAVKESGRFDLMNGSWVYHEGYPLYTNATCPYIDEGFDCDGNGRKDKSYMKLSAATRLRDAKVQCDEHVADDAREESGLRWGFDQLEPVGVAAMHVIGRR